MQNPTDDTIAQLEHDWPNWQVWVVYNVIGPPTWCARRRDDHRLVLNAGSAEHLAEYLEDELSEPGAVDSESWVCQGCGGQFIGGRPPGDLCGPCVVARLAYPEGEAPQ